MLRGEDKYERPIGVLFDAGEGRRISGQLTVKSSDLLDSNVVSIADNEFIHVADGGSLHGISEAGKVSVLDCVRGGVLGTTSWGDFAIHHGDVSFRFALFGKGNALARRDGCWEATALKVRGRAARACLHTDGALSDWRVSEGARSG